MFAHNPRLFGDTSVWVNKDLEGKVGVPALNIGLGLFTMLYRAP